MLCNVHVCLSRDLYFKKDLHRIYRKTCFMGFSIGLRFAIFRQNKLSFQWRNFPYEMPSIAACTGLAIRYTKAQ